MRVVVVSWCSQKFMLEALEKLRPFHVVYAGYKDGVSAMSAWCRKERIPYTVVDLSPKLFGGIFEYGARTASMLEEHGATVVICDGIGTAGTDAVSRARRFGMPVFMPESLAEFDDDSWGRLIREKEKSRLCRRISRRRRSRVWEMLQLERGVENQPQWRSESTCFG